MIDFVIDDEGDYESSMTGSDRRQEILKNIKESDRPVSGSKLAKDYDVSRQVIVQDIALLRAVNKDILATTKGYVLYSQQTEACHRIYCVNHSDDAIADELNTIVEPDPKSCWTISNVHFVKKVTLFAHKVNLFIWQSLTRHMCIQGVFLCQQLRSF